QDRVEVDDLLAIELQDDAQDAMRRWMLWPHVDEHLAIAERVELGLPLRPGRVRRHRLEDPEVALELDPGVVARTSTGRGHAFRPAFGARRTSAVDGALRGACVRSIGRTPAPGERAASSGR